VDEIVASQPRRALIVRAGALGDTLMTTPAIREFRRQHPAVEIDFLASAGGAQLLASNPHLAHIFVLQHRNLPYWLSTEKRRLIQELRARAYDVGIVLEAAPHYRELLERAAIPEIRDFRTTPFDAGLHNIINYARVSGFGDTRAMDFNMELPSPADAIESARLLLAGLPAPIVALHPGYGPGNKKKDQANRLRGWNPQNFARVASQLVSGGASIIFTGSPDDIPLCQEIARTLPSDRTRILAGRTSIPLFIAAIRLSELMISVDSASAHIAAAVGTPLVVLWGPAILHQTRPLSTASPVVVMRKPVPCAPCYGTPLMRTCQRNICMEQIEPEDVLQQARALLEKRSLPVL
jgi:ADP-heptose:LPS heptosyltransferase